MNIIQSFGTHNTTLKTNRKIKYIVIHFTAGTNSNRGAALNTASWFRDPRSGGSADFIVDDELFVQYNPDIANRYCWAIGGDIYTIKYTTEAAKFYNICTNANSISIEICSSKNNKGSLIDTDTDWYFTDAVVNNAVELTKYLMGVYDIDADHVIMHHHVTGKICPNPWVVNQSKLSGWYDFKKRISTNEVEDDDDMIRYERLSDINDKLFHGVIDDLMTAKIIAGDGSDPTGNNDVIDLSKDMVRILIFEYRAGVYDEALIKAGLNPDRYK